MARVQFSAALAAAVEAGLTADKGALDAAAQLLIEDQSSDGSWTIDPSSGAGSPATYGPAVATWLALDVLRRDPSKFRNPIERAERWLLALDVRTIPEAAAVLLSGVRGEPLERGSRSDTQRAG